MKIALVEDDERTRSRIVKLLVKSLDNVQVQEFSEVATARRFALDNAQDYWLIDLGLPDGSGVELIRAVRALYAGARILVISVFGNAEDIVRSIEAGANGYLLKDAIDKDLLQAIAAIGEGGTPLSPMIASRLLERMMLIQKPPPLTTALSPELAPPALLSARESELLNLLSRGYKYAEAAALMQVTLSTIQTYIRRIYIKLAVESKSEAIFEAKAKGLLPK